MKHPKIAAAVLAAFMAMMPLTACPLTLPMENCIVQAVDDDTIAHTEEYVAENDVTQETLTKYTTRNHQTDTTAKAKAKAKSGSLLETIVSIIILVAAALGVFYYMGKRAEAKEKK